jgi:hypothetical protein
MQMRLQRKTEQDLTDITTLREFLYVQLPLFMIVII